MSLILSTPIQASRPRRIARSIRTRKTDEESLNKIIRSEVDPVVEELSEKNGEISDEAFDELTAGVRDKLKQTIQKWADGVNAKNKADTEKMLARALGVDTAMIMDDDTVGKLIPSFADEAVNLIKGDLDTFKNDIKSAVLKNLQGIPFDDGRSLTDEIKHLAGVTKERAKLIARDQTHKINTGITQTRQTALGIEEYVWRTSQDQRVVGNPAGLYPKGNKVHGNHYERDGKTFKWSDPPFDGPPGYAINCRCTADPVIDIEKIDLSSGTVQPPAPKEKIYKGLDGEEYHDRERVETTKFGARLLREKLSGGNEGWEISEIEIIGETEKAWKLLVSVYSRYMPDWEDFKVMFLPKKGGIHKMRTDEEKEADYKRYLERKEAEKKAKKEAEMASPEYALALKEAEVLGFKIRKGTSLRTIKDKIWKLKRKWGGVLGR